jgi:hypothetical protein
MTLIIRDWVTSHQPNILKMSFNRRSGEKSQFIRLPKRIRERDTILNVMFGHIR